MLSNFKQWIETKVDSVLVDLEISNTNTNGSIISTSQQQAQPITGNNSGSTGMNLYRTSISQNTNGLRTKNVENSAAADLGNFMTF